MIQWKRQYLFYFKTVNWKAPIKRNVWSKLVTVMTPNSARENSAVIVPDLNSYIIYWDFH